MLAASVMLAGSPDASAETTFERIKRTGKVTVGTEAAFPPFEYIEDGKIVGYGKDILTYIIDDMNVELEQLDLPWQGILPGLLAKKFDFVATSVSVTAERVKKYAYTVPIAEGTSWLMKRVGDDRIGSVEDAAGMVVGTQLASAGEVAARAFEENVLQPNRGAGYEELKLYTAFPETYIALANGELDGVIQSVPNLAVLIKKQPGLFELVGPVMDQAHMGWVTRPEDKDLRGLPQLAAARDARQRLSLRAAGQVVRVPHGDSGLRLPSARRTLGQIPTDSADAAAILRRGTPNASQAPGTE